MKKTITTLATLALAASASAHTSVIPHEHAGSHTTWFTALAGVAALAVAVIAISLMRKKSSRAK